MRDAVRHNYNGTGTPPKRTVRARLEEAVFHGVKSLFAVAAEWMNQHEKTPFSHLTNEMLLNEASKKISELFPGDMEKIALLSWLANEPAIISTDMRKKILQGMVRLANLGYRDELDEVFSTARKTREQDRISLPKYSGLVEMDSVIQATLARHRNSDAALWWLAEMSLKTGEESKVYREVASLALELGEQHEDFKGFFREKILPQLADAKEEYAQGLIRMHAPVRLAGILKELQMWKRSTLTSPIGRPQPESRAD